MSTKSKKEIIERINVIYKHKMRMTESRRASELDDTGRRTLERFRALLDTREVQDSIINTIVGQLCCNTSAVYIIFNLGTDAVTNSQGLTKLFQESCDSRHEICRRATADCARIGAEKDRIIESLMLGKPEDSSILELLHNFEK